MVQKEQRLRRNWQFRQVFGKGRFTVGQGLIFYRLPNELCFNRIGLVASKKVGKAVMRNRAKRLMREAYHQLEAKMPQGYDLIFVARQAMAGCDLQQVLGEMKLLLCRTGFLQPQKNKQAAEDGKC
jgi:ribonuclease P protein component